MARRHLSTDEQALWSALARTVRPLHPRNRMPMALPALHHEVPPQKGLTPPPALATPPTPVRTPAAVLDTNWEKRIRNGTISPDMSIDLHGHSLSAAHARLHQALGAALAQGTRVILVVTGKPPRGALSGGASRRGAIRAEIGHWIETSAYADRIASVRVAHPRHGGEGALYLIMRRRK